MSSVNPCAHLCLHVLGVGKVGQADDLDFSEAEPGFDGRRDGPRFWFIPTTAKNAGRLDLDADVALQEKLVDGDLVFQPCRSHPGACEAVANALRDAP